MARTTRGAFTVKVRGYREVTRALNKVDRGTRKSLLEGLKKAAEPTAQDARSKLSGYAGLSTSTIQPRAVGTGVYITQKKGKTTGTRPDFGALQMRSGLLPAVYDHQDEFADKVDDALGALIRREGF
jgi:hypothetical protein